MPALRSTLVPWTLRLFLPLVAAYATVKLGPHVPTAVQDHPALTPVLMVVLLGVLLAPPIRSFAISALCFGIAFLAMRDAQASAAMPRALDYPLFHRIYLFVWSGVAGLAASAAVMEGLRPGSAGARRLYFATASLYLTGHGVIALSLQPTWGGLVLLTAGVGAALGAVYANRLPWGEEPVEPAPAPDPDAVLRARRRRVLAREWRDPRDHATSSGGSRSAETLIEEAPPQASQTDSDAVRSYQV